MSVKDFIKHQYRHFNAAVVVDASEAYIAHLARGGKMFLTMAGAMSTAELGLSLAEMIRQDKVHGICTTGANLEEDIFNLVAHNHYERVPNYRNLSDAEEVALRDRGMNRVTDTCIPEEEAMRRIERQVLKLWQKADKEKQRYFPYEYMYQLIRGGLIKEYYEIDPKDSWVIAACEKNLPIFTPGWEDSTLGNIFVANVIRGDVSNFQVVKSGVEQMACLIEWYRQNSANESIGFFQIARRHRGRFSDLRRAADHAGPARKVPAVGLLLPDFRQHDFVRLVQRRGAQRKNHLGKTGSGHAAIRHRVRRIDRRAADVRLYPRAVGRRRTLWKIAKSPASCGKRRNCSKSTAP